MANNRENKNDTQQPVHGISGAAWESFSNALLMMMRQTMQASAGVILLSGEFNDTVIAASGMDASVIGKIVPDLGFKKINPGIFESEIVKGLEVENPLAIFPALNFISGVKWKTSKGLSGAICLLYREQKIFTEEQKISLEKTASMLGSFITISGQAERRWDRLLHYRTLVDRARDVIYTSDRHGRFTFVSEGIEKLTGHRSKDLIGKHFTELIAPEFKEATENFYLEQARLHTEVTVREFPLITAFNTLKWVEQTVVLFLKDGKPESYEGIVRDIDQRKKDQEALEAATRSTEEIRKSFQLILDNTDLIISIKDLDFRYLLVNKKFEATFQVSTETLFKKTDQEMPAGLLPASFSVGDRDVLEKKKALHLERTIQTPSGEKIFMISKFPLLGKKGGLNAFCMIANDITARKKTEILLKQQDEKFSKVFHSNPAGLILFKAQNQEVVEINEAMCEITGYSKEEVLGKAESLKPVISEEEREKLVKIFKEKGVIKNLELILTHKSGMKKTVIHSSHTLEIGNQLHGLSIFYDVTEQKKLEKEVQEKGRLFSMMFHSSPAGMTLGTLTPYKFILANESFLAMTGFTHNELISLNFQTDSLIAKEEREKLFAIFKAKSSVKNEEVKIRCKDQSGKYVLLSSEKILLNGETHLLTVYNDITARKELEEELMKAKEAAEASGKAKEEFLANMSHEIRTPLNALMGFTDLLSETKLKTDQREYVQAMGTSGNTLLSVINDILDYSKMEAGMLTIEKQPLSIRILLDSLGVSFKEMARQKGLAFELMVDDQIPEVLTGDGGRLAQILTNLVGNAIKFTHEGKVGILARLSGRDESTAKVRIEVYDTGIGIPEDKKQSIFERFNQGNRDTTRLYGGTGLGLSIVKKLTTLQGGNIEVSGREGKGTVFSITIPYDISTETTPQNQVIAESFDLDAPKNKLILLVEDNRVNQNLAVRILSNFGFRTEVAENGKIAVERVKENNYDLILMDMQMPEMTGYEAAKVIRQDLKLHTPIIAMTAHALSSEREKCLQLGMNDYLSKPYKKEDLIRKIMHQFAMDAEALKTGGPDKKPGKIKPRTLNLSFLEDLSGGDKTFIAETLKLFLEDAPVELQKIERGISETEFFAIQQSAHKLKSMLTTVGLEGQLGILKEMELLGEQKKGMEKIKKNFKALNGVFKRALREAKVWVDKNLK